MLLDRKTILIMGGTGSLGKTMVRRILEGKHGTPHKIIVFSRDEAKQNDMRLVYLQKAASTNETIKKNFEQLVEFRIADVRDYADVCSALRDVEIVIYAAALKQVPSCEYFPIQAIATNCLGANNVVRAILENALPVETVLGVSTDKAAKPVNVMGMTKALQERIFTSANILNKKTRFICVRYGNVLASRGSVIPLFLHQISEGGPVTITDPQMTRFLLSLEAAVDTIFEALRHAKHGETYVPDVRSATIMDIARALVGDRPIEIKTVGVRPGEKTHEILVSEEEIRRCRKRGGYYVILPILPELKMELSEEESDLSEEFCSAKNLLDFESIVQMLKEHKLMIEDYDFEEEDELLR